MGKNTSPISAQGNHPALKRNFNLDIIRIVAFMFIPGIHFFLHTGYYGHAIDNPTMVFMTFLKTLFMLCIPLFLMITGYLQGEKQFEPGKKYYFKITKILIPYLMIMLLDLIYINNVLGSNFIYREYKMMKFGLRENIENFTSFTHYSWYVNMYIGLFLLIPFLNMIWQNLKTKKQEHLLLATLIFITIIPSVFNAYEFDAENGKWFAGKNSDYWQLVPDWWTGFYPITYYFTGAYLSRHRSESKMKPFVAFLIFLAAWGGFGTYYVCRCWKSTGSIYSWTNYNSAGIFLIAVTLFVFLNSFNFKRIPLIIRKTAGKLSDLTFGAYLCSWMLDQYMYRHQVNKMYNVYEDRFSLFVPAWLIAIAVAFAMSFCVDLIYRAGCMLCKDAVNKLKHKKK